MRNGTAVEYGYDGAGQRVRKTDASGTVRYLYAGADLFAELDSAGVVRRAYSYFPGVDQPHAVKVDTAQASQRYFYATEAPGHVAGLFDGSNNIVDEYRYSAFGEAQVAQEGVSQPLRYMARELDAGTGLYQVRARWYDPDLERFVSSDPIGLAGGINAYAYAGNDPVNLTDPSGLAPGECLWGGDRFWCEGIIAIGWRNGEGVAGRSLPFAARAGSYGLCPVGERPTRNTKDCPNDAVGRTLQFIDRYGGELGRQTLQGIVDRRLRVEALSLRDFARECGNGWARACSDVNGRTIYVNFTDNIVDRATDVVHETSHFIPPSGRGIGWDEVGAIRRAHSFMDILPGHLRGISEQLDGYYWAKRDPRGFQDAICNTVVPNMYKGATCQGY